MMPLRFAAPDNPTADRRQESGFGNDFLCGANPPIAVDLEFNQKSGLGNFDHQFADIYPFEQAVERFRSVLQAIDNGFTVLQFALADPLNELAPALLPSRHEV
jgi:hypothetical protein